MKYIVWGLGKYYTKCSKYIRGEVVAYIDNNCVGKIMPDGKTVIDIYSIEGLEYDKIIICSTKYREQMLEQLINLNICATDQILFLDDMISQVNFFEIFKHEIGDISNAKINREELHKIKNVYVLAPGSCKSGGPELLHQLVYILNKNSVCAKIVYVSDNNSGVQEKEVSEFSKYVSRNVVKMEEVEDSEENVIVLPEVWPSYITKFRNARKYFWWMSVDNFIASAEKGDVENVLKNTDLHLYQSEYARLFLKKLYIGDDQMRRLSDYINDDYLQYSEEEISKNNRENIIVYNPKKGFTYTHKIMKNMSGFIFTPICNMNNQEVKNLLAKSKVYIDFGNHPGKDRIPREAAIMGCCVITGRHGSADNNVDIRIDDFYKFDQDTESVEVVVDRIKYCLENYETCIKDFEDYRAIIREEKNEFELCARDIFVSN